MSQKILCHYIFSAIVLKRHGTTTLSLSKLVFLHHCVKRVWRKYVTLFPNPQEDLQKEKRTGYHAEGLRTRLGKVLVSQARPNQPQRGSPHALVSLLLATMSTATFPDYPLAGISSVLSWGRTSVEGITELADLCTLLGLDTETNPHWG